MIAKNFSFVSTRIFSIFHPCNFAICPSLAFPLGRTDTVITAFSCRRNTIWVAKRVANTLSRGKGSPVRPSRTELLPLVVLAAQYFTKKEKEYHDLSPTTTIYSHASSYSGRAKCESRYLLVGGWCIAPHCKQTVCQPCQGGDGRPDLR